MLYASIRDKRGTTDYAVAQACGFTASTFSDWKKGRYMPKVDKLAKIAEVLGVGVNVFLGEYK